MRIAPSLDAMRNFLLVLSFASLAAGCGGTVDTSPDQSPARDAGLQPDDAAQTIDSSEAAPLPDAATPDSSVPPTTPPADQKILFEMSYVNYAWAPAVNGFYVTADGSVFKYDYYTSLPDAGDPFVSLEPGMTEAQVTGKHGPSPAFVTKFDMGTLLQRFSLVGAARGGTLLHQYLCADAGEARYVAYLFDPASSTYSPVMLGSSGDRATRNTAPEADALMNWLRTLGAGNGQFCDYPVRSCDKELCDGTPACQAGEVPVSQPEAACADYCSSPASCDHVADCSVCTNAKTACLVDQLGVAHCVHQPYICSGAMTCECAADEICAGGKSYCHGDEMNGLRCSAP